MAALYGLEARACGRAGQTLFRTGRSGPLTPEGQAQARGPPLIISSFMFVVS